MNPISQQYQNYSSWKKNDVKRFHTSNKPSETQGDTYPTNETPAVTYPYTYTSNKTPADTFPEAHCQANLYGGYDCNASYAQSLEYPPEWLAYWAANYPGWNSNGHTGYYGQPGAHWHGQAQWPAIAFPQPSSSSWPQAPERPQTARPPTRRSGYSAASRSQGRQRTESRTSPYGVDPGFAQNFRSVPSRFETFLITRRRIFVAFSIGISL